ncbi:MAG: glycoside hydrolase family 9 protein [Bacteroidota bacterium]
MLTVWIFLFGSSCQPFSTPDSLPIHVNQIGYYPTAVKKAILPQATTASMLFLLDQTSGDTVAKVSLSEEMRWDLAGHSVRVADFSSVQTPGRYYLKSDQNHQSPPFHIQERVLSDVLKGSAKALYYQRASSALPPEYAGRWHRPLGHPDTALLYHPSSGKSEGQHIAPGGWYDAGDFNKYIVNACFPMGQYFSLLEQYPNSLPDGSLNIPESDNEQNDLLDELKYSLDWALSMQDEDGGLFHKLTTKKFEGVKMPHEAVEQRYIVGKGTTATLNFAAASAQAYRLFLGLDPPYASRCLQAAERAWAWAVQHPAVAYQNPEDIQTGEYGDKNFTDEWFWAAAELFVSTGSTSYRDTLLAHIPRVRLTGPSGWNQYMSNLAAFRLLQRELDLPREAKELLREKLFAEANRLVETSKTNDYFQPVLRFKWGSNSDVLNAAMFLANAHRISPNPAYLSAIQEMVDYILGKNPLGICFVTGYGTHSPMHIHHRQSMADGIEDPVPGLLSGGPNIHQQDTSDGTVYPADVSPMTSWVDHSSSYASNEICLNWNAPLTYVLGFLEAQTSESN